MATRYRWDDFRLDLDAHRLERAGTALALEPKAFNLLALMVQRPGRLLTKQEIFERIWPDTAVTDHALTRVVAQLRRVLGDEAREARFLETVPTLGYRWIRPVDVEDAHPPLVTAASPPVPAAEQPLVQKPIASRIPARAAAVLLTSTLVLGAVVWVQRNAYTRAADVTREAVRSAGRGPIAPWPVQLTTNAGLDAHPTLSPQGDAMAFASDRGGGLEIYVRTFGGTTQELPLTADGGQNVEPAWSPDGRFIAYHSYHHGGIWVMPARGGTPRQVSRLGSRPAWSADSRRLAFQSDELADASPFGYGAQAGSTIWVVDADGRGAQAVTRTGDPSGGHSSPAWSPDGRFIAFTVFDGATQNGLWVRDLHEARTTRLYQGPPLYEAVFASDGSALYVAGGAPLVHRLPFDATTGRLAGPVESFPVPGVPGVRGLSLSSDGRQLAFGGPGLSSQIWWQPIDGQGSPTGPAAALTNDTSRRNSLPSVSPDGARVAYMSTRRGEAPNVWVMNIDGSQPIQLTANETADLHPTWLAASRVAYLSIRGGIKGVWSVDVKTRREEPLFVLEDGTRGPAAPRLNGTLAEVAATRSLSRAAFSLLSPPAGRRVLYVANLNPFVPRVLTDPALSVGYPAWSPDERRLAVEIQDADGTQAGVIDVATGTLRPLTEGRGQTWVRSWSPDGRRIAAAVFADGQWSLRWIEADTGRQGTIAPPAGPSVYVRYPAWSPRGDRILYERAEMRGNIWLMTLPGPGARPAPRPSY